MPSELHVIFGTGPVGCWIARTLRELNVTVRAVSRSGKRPALMPDDVEIIAADASNAQQAIDAAKGGRVVYQALNPPYHKWHELFPGLQNGALAAARAADAHYVSIENLYMYDSSKPMNEDSPTAPRSKKGDLRARMAEQVLAAGRRGEIQATALRSSDYYGPGVLGSALGDMVFGNLMKGKKPQVGGSADKPHSFAYIEDVGRAAVIIGTRKEALGKVWIAPHARACTQREMIEIACRQLAVKPQISVISPFVMRLAGMFIPEARTSVEMMYEFTEAFVVDSNRIQRTFGLQPTPADTGVERTLRWYEKHFGKH